MIEKIDSDVLNAQRFDFDCLKATKRIYADINRDEYSQDRLQTIVVVQRQHQLFNLLFMAHGQIIPPFSYTLPLYQQQLLLIWLGCEIRPLIQTGAEALGT